MGHPSPDRVVAINRPRIVRTLVVITLVLIAASLAVDVTAIQTGHDRIFGLLPLFDLDREGNIPTFFSAVLLLGAGLLCGFAGLLDGQRGGRERNYWRALCVIFAYLAIDEASLIHELTIEPMHHLIGNLGPAFRFAWVIPAIVLVGIGGLLFLRFFLRLPPPIRTRVAIAAIMFVGGSIGFEIISGGYLGAHPGGERNAAYILIFTTEESLEMFGMIVFINALLRHIDEFYQAGRWTPSYL